MSGHRILVVGLATVLICALTGPAGASDPRGGAAPSSAHPARAQVDERGAGTAAKVRKARQAKRQKCRKARRIGRNQAGTAAAKRAAAQCERAKKRLQRVKLAHQRSKQQPVQRSGFREYVSLGDSWSADVVLLDTHGLPDTTHVPVDCAQSKVNYPKLVARELAIPVHRDPTCGSATTRHFSGAQSLPLGGTNTPQFDRLSTTTDLVTIGIGGNDAGFAAAALDCINLLPTSLPPGTLPALPNLPLPLLPSQPPIGGCKGKFTSGGTDVLAQQIDASRPLLVAAIKEVRRRAPRARILMLDYIAGIPERACWPIVPITQEDMTYLHQTFARLNAMVRRAAREGGAEFVDTHTPTLGHDVCQLPTVRYVEGLGVVSVNGVAVAVPAHPNSAGAAAQARAVLHHIRTR
ncbi:SGNH/GDSL hydrolase family protein [Nocardioides sp.]|uniref:SGNH/GDSL hydrolase family protein n=1 Tax=Nocardioides sp. TaxID=35761 RepID=UPI0027367B8C|nr:SGNH/GDSL hydrolase family protein [Nocardioides sp.]MDP3892800.1 SGNH/GDSL hydrolase family protein [Nocardioides sp.]